MYLLDLALQRLQDEEKITFRLSASVDDPSYAVVMLFQRLRKGRKGTMNPTEVCRDDKAKQNHRAPPAANLACDLDHVGHPRDPQLEPIGAGRLGHTHASVSICLAR